MVEDVWIYYTYIVVLRSVGGGSVRSVHVV